MKSWLKRIAAWRSQRRQDPLSHRVRAKGKARYVLRIALEYILLMVVGIGTMQFFDDGIQFSDFRFWVFALPITGIFWDSLRGGAKKAGIRMLALKGI
jgi:hypothetical protein